MNELEKKLLAQCQQLVAARQAVERHELPMYIQSIGNVNKLAKRTKEQGVCEEFVAEMKVRLLELMVCYGDARARFEASVNEPWPEADSGFSREDEEAADAWFGEHFPEVDCWGVKPCELCGRPAHVTLESEPICRWCISDQALDYALPIHASFPPVPNWFVPDPE